MVLHRDIYWVGRQWAVTGYGVQACDQKQKSKFDIEASRLWEEDVLESLRTQPWLNVEDLDKALAVARARFPEPSRNGASPKGVPEAASPSSDAIVSPARNGIAVEPLRHVVAPERPQAQRHDPVTPIAAAAGIAKPQPAADAAAAAAKPAAAGFHFKWAGSAKFVKPWRIKPKR
jgi:hypothetical protein